MAEGFASRWSRRKQQSREGLPLAEPETARAATPSEVVKPDTVVSTTAPGPQVETAAARAEQVGATKVPSPTLEDVKALTPDSDFRAFVARDVDPEVRNAAMKKLFADPHYNLMDGLDTYIDDYSKPDPIPASMLRQIASAQFLNLFDDEEKQAAKMAPRADENPGAAAHKKAEASPAGPQAQTETTPSHHAHTDLRLQQDHAAGAQGSGDGAG